MSNETIQRGLIILLFAIIIIAIYSLWIPNPISHQEIKDKPLCLCPNGTSLGPDCGCSSPYDDIGSCGEADDSSCSWEAKK
jgi:hypothetical protein